MSRIARGQSSTASADGAPPSYAGELFLEIYKLVHFSWKFADWSFLLPIVLLGEAIGKSLDSPWRGSTL